METLLKVVVGALLIAIGLFFVGWAMALVLAVLIVFGVSQLVGLKITVTKNNKKIGYIKYFKFHQTND